MAKTVTSILPRISVIESWASFFGFSPRLVLLEGLNAGSAFNSVPAGDIVELYFKLPSSLNAKLGDGVGFVPQYVPTDARIVYISAEVHADNFVSLYFGNAGGASTGETANIDGYLVLE